MQVETCVFHSDPVLFKTAVRDLQRSGIIRRAQAPSVPMAVCSCRKKATFCQNLTTDQIWNAADHVIAELDQKLSKLTTTTNDLITSSANIARRTHSVTSYARFVVVISQALLGDVTLVSEERRRSPKTRTSRPTHRLALNIVKRIIDKKKQRCPIQTKFCLPLFGGMTSVLFRQPQIGFNFSRLCVSHACVLEMDSAATAEYMRLNKQTTVVSAWFSDTKVMDVVRRKLTACSLAVKKVYIQRPRAVKCYRKAYLGPTSRLEAIEKNLKRPGNQLSDDFASLGT
ncbi:hypothetical protein C0Q70_08112 [Pomacea canaliculata]|uniref:Uncharacterized protein n=1 Tax=Pomacea canaliculata TaxID=400727 RepID=A0A2T7PGY4_POMCA|nr:hypothetical protein C0Q70_08112 [Pomacea canaliculata]